METNNNPSVSWKKFFEEWPKDLKKGGSVVTVLNEPIPFKGFMVTDSMLLIERQNPDPMGTRIIILTFDQIAEIKLTDVAKEAVFKEMGFTGKLSKK